MKLRIVSYFELYTTATTVTANYYHHPTTYNFDSTACWYQKFTLPNHL